MEGYLLNSLRGLAVVFCPHWRGGWRALLASVCQNLLSGCFDWTLLASPGFGFLFPLFASHASLGAVFLLPGWLSGWPATPSGYPCMLEVC